MSGYTFLMLGVGAAAVGVAGIALTFWLEARAARRERTARGDAMLAATLGLSGGRRRR